MHFLGMPEAIRRWLRPRSTCRRAPKSNAVYRAYMEAAEAASQEVAEPVPMHLRNAPTRLMKELDYGKGYRYAHDEPDWVAADMECLPPAHAGRRFYEPTSEAREKRNRERLDERRAASATGPSGTSPRAAEE